MQTAQPGQFVMHNGTTIYVTEPWKTQLKVSRIESGSHAMRGFADASNRRDGFRWEREGSPRFHTGKAYLDNVTIYSVATGEEWGRGSVTVYLLGTV